MKLAEFLSIPKSIKKLPEEKLAVPLFIAHWVIYLILPLIVSIIALNDPSFKNTFDDPSPLKITTVVATFGTAVLYSAVRMGLVAILMYAAAQALATRKIHIHFWKILNVYVYAKVWELLVALLINLIILILSATVLESWFNFSPKLFSWVIIVTTYIPIIIFYAIFIFGLVKIMPRKTAAPETL